MPDDRSNDNRPSPDALLEHAEREERGRLRIFLGAAPGVGKTYEMLSAGRRRKADGVDVVVGIVETHGRAETEAQLAGLEFVRYHVPFGPSYRRRKLRAKAGPNFTAQRRTRSYGLGCAVHEGVEQVAGPDRCFAGGVAVSSVGWVPSDCASVLVARVWVAGVRVGRHRDRVGR